MSNQHYSFSLLGEPVIREALKLRNIASAKYEGDWLSIPHAHNYTELFYIIDGDGIFQIEDRSFPVEANQLVVVNPNVIHTELSHDSRPMEYIVVGLEGMELKLSGNQDDRFCLLTFPGQDSTLMCMQNILAELQTRSAEYETVCQAYLEILVVQLIRSANFSFSQASTRPPVNRLCSFIRHYIDNHYKERLTLDLLAQVGSVNKYYLAHAYKEEFGTSPISYMNFRRVEEGKRLLSETDWSLSQIAHILGFSSASYFSQAFRNLVGVSPMEYRKQHCTDKQSST